MHVIIEPAVAELLPDLCVGIVVARGLDNRAQAPEPFQALLDQGSAASRKHLPNPEFAENPVIAVWRAAFKRFKIRKGARSSIEALLKRLQNGNPVNPINPLVDIYNFISMKHAIPCGGETLQAIRGDLRLAVAEGGEGFRPLGAEADDPALPGEVIYRDDLGAVCRCLNWREAQRTMLTEDTTEAVLCLELVDRARWAELPAVLEELAALVRSRLGGTTEILQLQGAGRVQIQTSGPGVARA